MSFLAKLFHRRDRLVFVTRAKSADDAEYQRKKAETTAALRRYVAAHPPAELMAGRR